MGESEKDAPFFRVRDFETFAGPNRIFVEGVRPEMETGNPVLLFIGGAFDGSWICRQQLDYWASRGWPAFALNLRGYYKSRCHDVASLDYRDYLDDILAVRDHLKLNRVVYVGYSMGGILAQKVAELYGAHALVLYDSDPPRQVAEIAGVQTGEAADARDVMDFWPGRDIVEEMSGGPVSEEEYAGILECFKQSFLSGRVYRELEVERVEVDAEKVDCPVLVVGISAEDRVQAALADYYDALNRRIKTEEIDGETTTTTQFVYDDAEAIIEQDDEDDIIATYTYGPGIDNIISMRRNGQSYFYIKDALGSVTAITDSDGNIVESYSYDAYGRPTIYNSNGIPISESAIGNSYLFTGRRYTSAIKLYYYRARYYDGDLGKFFSKDPIGLENGHNLYSYANCNPIMLTDPTGQVVRRCTRALRGGWPKTGPLYHEYIELNGKTFGFYPKNEKKFVGPGKVVHPDPPKTIPKSEIKDVHCEIVICGDERCVSKEITYYRAFPGWFIFGERDCQWWTEGILFRCGYRIY